MALVELMLIFCGMKIFFEAQKMGIGCQKFTAMNVVRCKFVAN